MGQWYAKYCPLYVRWIVPPGRQTNETAVHLGGARASVCIPPSCHQEWAAPRLPTDPLLAALGQPARPAPGRPRKGALPQGSRNREVVVRGYESGVPSAHAGAASHGREPAGRGDRPSARCRVRLRLDRAAQRGDNVDLQRLRPEGGALAGPRYDGLHRGLHRDDAEHGRHPARMGAPPPRGAPATRPSGGASTPRTPNRRRSWHTREPT